MEEKKIVEENKFSYGLLVLTIIGAIVSIIAFLSFMTFYIEIKNGNIALALTIGLLLCAIGLVLGALSFILDLIAVIKNAKNLGAIKKGARIAKLIISIISLILVIAIYVIFFVVALPSILSSL